MRIWVGSLLLLGCASGGAQGTAGDTDTDTDSLTSFGPTGDTFESSSGEPPDDESDPGTTFESDSISGTGTSSGTSGSTGCVVGEAGCACDGGDPPCADGLECDEDAGVCVEPLCADKEHEDNDAMNDAFDLGDYEDGDPAMMFSSSLSGTEDVDWFVYSCADILFDEVDPRLMIDSEGPFRACFFLECTAAFKPLFDCPAGTTEETAPIDFIPGCCVDDASTIDLSNFNCPDTDDESVNVYIKTEMAQEEACIGYTMTYNC